MDCGASFTVVLRPRFSFKVRFWVEAWALNLKPSIAFQPESMQTFVCESWRFNWICIGTYRLQQGFCFVAWIWTYGLFYSIWNLICTEIKEKKVNFLLLSLYHLTCNMYYSDNKYSSQFPKLDNLTYFLDCAWNSLNPLIKSLTDIYSFFCHLTISDWFSLSFLFFRFLKKSRIIPSHP